MSSRACKPEDVNTGDDIEARHLHALLDAVDDIEVANRVCVRAGGILVSFVQKNRAVVALDKAVMEEEPQKRWADPPACLSPPTR
jgi:hypothetical protein